MDAAGAAHRADEAEERGRHLPGHGSGEAGRRDGADLGRARARAEPTRPQARPPPPLPTRARARSSAGRAGQAAVGRPRYDRRTRRGGPARGATSAARPAVRRVRQDRHRSAGPGRACRGTGHRDLVGRRDRARGRASRRRGRSEAVKLDAEIAKAEELRRQPADRLGRGELELDVFDAAGRP